MNDTITFIRHNFDNAVEMHEYCLQNNYIAIHFTPEGHIDWEDYSMQAKEGKGFKRAFQTLQNLGRIGGLVVAQYDPPGHICKRPKQNTVKGKRVKAVLR